MQKLVVVGGGFAGVWAAVAAARTARRQGRGPSDLEVTLVSRDPWLTIRPRLYEASLDGVRVRLDDVLRPAGVERVEGNVTRIDTRARTIGIEGYAGAHELPWDRLVLAAGSHLRRPDVPGAERAFSVDTFSEATRLRRHLVSLASGGSASGHEGRFTAVVVGAGFTGIEVATELVPQLRVAAARSGATDRVRVILVDRAPAVASDLGPGARAHVEDALESLGIETRPGTSVSAVEQRGVVLTGGAVIPAATVVWTGGFRASALGELLPAERDASGRVVVDAFLRVGGVEGVYAAGDVAHAMADAEHVAPMACQLATPMGDRAGRNAAADLLGLPGAPYAHPDYVTCLDLGEAGALFMQGWDREVRLTGFWAKVMKQAINTRLIYPVIERHAVKAWPAGGERPAA